MNSIFGLMAISGGNFVSIAHLEIPLLIKMLMCQILIFPAVYIHVCMYVCIFNLIRFNKGTKMPLHHTFFKNQILHSKWKAHFCYLSEYAPESGII